MRGVGTTAAAAAALLALVAATAHGARSTRVVCTVRSASSAYSASVQQAVDSKTDYWGSELLHAPAGPTLAGAQRFLGPITEGLQWAGHALTTTGAYYLPFSYPFTSNGSTVFALHVADGSEIITRRVGGPSLAIFVGHDGTEQYGSCAARSPGATLVDGYLPVLDTSYTDTQGIHYKQESFVGRSYGSYGARSVISYVRLTVDTRKSRYSATVRLVPSLRLAHSGPDRLALKGQARLIVTPGADFVAGVVRYRVPAHTIKTFYALWLNAPSNATYVHATEAGYLAARANVEKFWQDKLATGATYSVPEPAVQNAEQGILTQLIAYGWRYSIGNPYEELSYAESLDAAEVAAEYGFGSVAKSILDFALLRMKERPWRFTAFRGAHILSTAATYVRLTHDTTFLKSATPELADLVAKIAARQVTSGKKKGQLLPEALSTDLEGQPVDSVSGQVEAIVGLRSLAGVWGIHGYAYDAKRARDLATSIDAALAPAVKKGSKRLEDGTLFVPDQLPQKPFDRVTSSREGSYWNLVMPYAFASGWFTAGSPVAKGILGYLQQHGSRMLGMPRTYARTVYGDAPGAGIAQVYELGFSRFFADNDQPDQLVLSLYGMLAAGMTGTYVSGEAVSALPVAGAYDRAMFMPPNTGANASYLENLRLQLVHERRGPLGAPAASRRRGRAPRAWLADGKQIEVTDAPTSFGSVSYTLARHGSTIDGRLRLPAYAHARIRLRLPAGERLAHVTVGTKSVVADAAGTIDLDGLRGAVTLRAVVA